MKTREYAFGEGRASGNVVRSMLSRDAGRPQMVGVTFALCSLLMMMSVGMTVPTFAHLFKGTSAGVAFLSGMMLIPHLVLFALAPLAGNLADRYGRYPFLVIAFVGLMAANLGDIFAHTPAVYMGIHIFQSIACVGARPAMMGILADRVPEKQRERQLGLIMTGFAGGMTLGPVCGGFLVQQWGAAAAFAASAGFNGLALCLVCFFIPTTFPRRAVCPSFQWRPSLAGWRGALILPFSFFAGLLLLEFIMLFGRTFVEPQLVLYMTKVLCFSPVSLGLILSCHGLALACGTLVANRADRLVGKHLAIATGFLMQALFILSLLLTHQFYLLLLASLLSGLGGGLVLPLLGACYLACTKADHQARIIGIKEAVGALGGIAGALPVLCASHWLNPHMVFALGGGIIASGGLVTLCVLKAPRTTLPMLPMSSRPFFSPVPTTAGSASLD